MSISSTSNVANVTNHLQQLSETRKQQIEVDLEVGESTRRARQQAVDQSLENLNKQAERVNEIKKTGLQVRGSVDVWA